MTSGLTNAVFGDRYRVVEAVGSGGMATVYRGVDTVLGRDVAIKVMHPHLAARSDARARFSREAQAIARLHHPNIVDVYDFSHGESESAYLVTEFVHGVTLTEFTAAHGPFLPQSAALIGQAIASALAHAHAAGIVHRDIKPDNLMISRDGTIKLMDFGIATAMDLEQMTATGAILGSPAHMAPEQIEGRTVDARVDVFAFGTLLYALVAGRLPFMASNPHALFRLILEGVYDPPSRHNAVVGRRFEELLATCLARDPDDRWSTMSAAQEALAAYLRDHELVEPDKLLRRLLTAPEQFQHEIRPNLITVLCAEGRREAREGSLALAIDAYNRAMAIDPDAVEPRRGLTELTSQSRRKRRLRAVAAVALGALVTTGLAVAVRRHFAEPATAPGPEVPAVAPAVAVQPPQLLPPNTAELAAAEERDLQEAKRQSEIRRIEAELAARAAQTAPVQADAGATEPKQTERVAAAQPAKAPPRGPPRPSRRPPASKANEETTVRSAGPKLASPPEPEDGLVEVTLGSTPAWAKLYLDNKLVSDTGFARVSLVSGSRHTLRCEPFLNSCPECPRELTRPVLVPDRPPDVPFRVACDFRQWAPARAAP